MGDSEDGSSEAARGAQHQKTDHETGHETGADHGQKKGLFTWLTDAFGGGDSDTPDEEPQDSDDKIYGNGLALGLSNLRRMRVEDVATPKAEIVAVPQDIRKDALVGVFRESGMTRLPVYKGTLDSPTGMVHLKDFALSYGFNGEGGRFSLRKMLRPLLYAPPSMPIGVLLQKMQSQRMHMALVIDEYGGVDGLVTIEDLIEQVVGEIEDEHDTEEDRFFTVEKSGSFLALAKTPIDEFQSETGLDLLEAEEEEEIDTLGGLVFMLAGRVPARGEVIPHPNGVEFEVVDADPRRIKRLRVRVPASS